VTTSYLSTASNTAQSLTLVLTVAERGSFTVTVTQPTVVLSSSGSTATGTLPDTIVSDTRNYFPGWSVTGQEGDFTGSGQAAGHAFSGNQLGWAPTSKGPLVGKATLGPVVSPGSPGLGTAATLASARAGAGFGKNVFSANLTVHIPSAVLAGTYRGIMTITFVEAAL
jgi:hypothetical protein